VTDVRFLRRRTIFLYFNSTKLKEVLMAMRKILSVLVTACSMLFAWSPMSTYAASTTLQTANNSTGNQAYSGVGVRFDVNSAVSVTALGIFDSSQDGIAALPTDPLSAYLLTSTGGVVANITFDSLSQGTLEADYRFKPITPVTLLPGTYVLAGYGWNATDLEHNCNISGACDTFNDGGGLLTYLGSPFGGGSDPAGTLPTTECCGNLNFFSAANMQFTGVVGAVPEPETYALTLAGLGLLGFIGRRRKQKAA
jgi:hypothetical protein